jgi:hypothetical protein
MFPRKVKANVVNKQTKNLATSKKDLYETGFRRKWLLLLQVWLAQVTST